MIGHRMKLLLAILNQAKGCCTATECRLADTLQMERKCGMEPRVQTAVIGLCLFVFVSLSLSLSLSFMLSLMLCIYINLYPHPFRDVHPCRITNA